MNKYLGLLRWSLKYQDGTNNDAKPMDPERRKWLMEAIESQIVDPVEQMKNVLEVLKLEHPGEDSEDLMDYNSKRLEALREIHHYIDNFDLARDFWKIGGMEAMLGLIQNCQDIKGRCLALEILSVLTQNHIELQQQLFEKDGLTTIMDKLQKEDTHSSERAKAIGALGSLLRGNDAVTNKFLIELKGLPMLFNILRTYIDFENETNDHQRIIRKTLFLVKYFVDTVEDVRVPLKLNFEESLAEVNRKTTDVDSKELSQQISDILNLKST